MSLQQIAIEIRALALEILKRTTPMPVQSQRILAGAITQFANEIESYLRKSRKSESDMWSSWATWVWIGIVLIGVAWEVVGLLFRAVPTLSELITTVLRDIGPYGRVAFVVIWIYLAWHFLTGRIYFK